MRNKRNKKKVYHGFTLIELVIVITILAILAAVAIPAFVNLTARAKDAGARGAVGGLRSAVAIYKANELADGRTGNYPSLASMQDSADTASSAGNPKAMENGDTPDNPWCSSTTTQCSVAGDKDKVAAAPANTSSTRTISAVGAAGAWLYDTGTGLIYANSSANTTTNENSF